MSMRNGRDDEPVETEVQEAKSISAEHTFARDIVNPSELDREMFNVACIVAHRLRKQGFMCSCVSMFIKFADFSVAQKQCQLPQPTDITALVLNEARRLLSEVWDGSGSDTPGGYRSFQVYARDGPCRCHCSKIPKSNITRNGTANMTAALSAGIADQIEELVSGPGRGEECAGER